MNKNINEYRLFITVNIRHIKLNKKSIKNFKNTIAFVFDF